MIYTDLNKLELKKNCDYLIILGKKSGMRIREAEELNKMMHKRFKRSDFICVLVEDINEIKVLGIPKSKVKK